MGRPTQGVNRDLEPKRMEPRLPTKPAKTQHFRVWLLLALVVSQLVAAQNPDIGAEREPIEAALAEFGERRTEPVSDDVIDEITVKGRRSLNSIQRDIYEADDTLYNLFNSLNSDNKYDVYCKREMRTGTNIKSHRICRPQFERDLMFDTREEVSGSFSTNLPTAEIRRHRAVMREKMLSLAMENPGLSEAILKRAELQRAYDLERKRRLE